MCNWRFKAINGDEVSKQQLLISKARRLLIDGKIDFEDFSNMKKELKEMLDYLNNTLTDINTKFIYSNNDWASQTPAYLTFTEVRISLAKDIL